MKKIGKIYFTGQTNFCNRGCEAIVRSTVEVFRSIDSSIHFIVPSNNIQRDVGQWPDAEKNGVLFSDAFAPLSARLWVHAQRMPFAALKRKEWPFSYPNKLKQEISSSDLVLAIGGDNYSLDYRIPSLVMSQDKLAMDTGTPTCLWGASVGPFEKEPVFVPTIKSHLSRMSSLRVRESTSYHYLTEKLGLKNVVRMVDPAFALRPEEFDISKYIPSKAEQGIVGINVSPLIERYKKKGQVILDEISEFIKYLINDGYGVLLVPHVTNLNDSEKNDDFFYMKNIFDKFKESIYSNHIKILPSTLNAAQLKYAISRTRFFVGARTHSTIAAMSSGVPVISIAYSIKAKGINKDLFGDESLVLATPEVSVLTLKAKFKYMLSSEDRIKLTLSEKVSEYKNIIIKSANDIVENL